MKILGQVIKLINGKFDENVSYQKLFQIEMIHLPNPSWQRHINKESLKVLEGYLDLILLNELLRIGLKLLA